MKFIRILAFTLFFVPVASMAASNDFMLAAQLLAAAKSGDIAQVQSLVNNGANVNFVDSTGLSIVCTALMNNDVRAAQILQMYGADASGCDRQIKQYNNKNKPRGGGGLFSGLSSAQSISLAAAGAAVVVGGLFLLTDVFDPGNDNNSSSSGGSRPDNNPGTDTGGNVTVAFTLPYGPAMPTAEDESAKYVQNLDFYSPAKDGDKTEAEQSIYYKNFQLMTNGGASVGDGQNYLLMMHGYSPLARGYMGMRTLRSASSGGPLDLSGSSLWGETVMGGRPVNVALVTDNGINATSNSSLGDTLMPWTTVNSNGSTIGAASKDTVSSKYYNNALTLTGEQNSWNDFVTTENTSVAVSSGVVNFDLAGYGTVIHNISASNDDNLLAKVVGGNVGDYSNADYIGFMPNGQMTIFRTGGGTEMATISDQVATGTYTENDGVLSQLELFGKTLAVVINNGVISASYTETNTDDEGNETENTITYSGYIGADGNLYIDSNADGVINQAYAMDSGNLTLVKQAQDADYYNYRALLGAADLWRAGDLKAGRSRPDVIANASVIAPLRGYNVEQMNSVLSGADDAERAALLATYVDKYYDVNTENAYEPAVDAINFLKNLGTQYAPMTVFSTGAFETNSSYLGETLSATFENAVPLIYENAEHLFMSVVGVGLTGDGTEGTTSVSGYSPSGKIALTQWHDTDADKYYKARTCGIAGTGAGDIDPWCFAAAGVTDELAVSSAAGAVGALKSAFSSVLTSNEQIFALLALTADGPFLGTTTDGAPLTEDALVSHLESLYQLPNEYQFQVDAGADYLDTFAQVFGYGLINLERATKPGTSVYYYNGNNIVSADGNAYWRAATNTIFRPSSVLNLRGASVRAPFFDVLESVDGKMSLPRVWENEFAFGALDKGGLYMGDVLGDMKTRRDNAQRNQIGAVGVTMSFSERAYDDNLGGLDNLSLDFVSGPWRFGASYQHYLTDGMSRFSGMSNPILGLASYAVVSDAEYKSGNWTFGARAFSGAITDEGLLENDPTISAQYMPAKLGLVQGGVANIAWKNDTIGFVASVGNAHETDTLLGAQTGGLLDLGNGDTLYVDALARYRVSDRVEFSARATFAQTSSDMAGDFILGLTDIKSNSFAFGANIGNFEFSVAQPLAVMDGALQYAHAEYDVVEVADGKYDLNVVNAHVADLSLAADKRETRFMATYRHNFGEFTDGAFGFIYRVNPNHTDEFGDESVFMLKLSHRLGI